MSSTGISGISFSHLPYSSIHPILPWPSVSPSSLVDISSLRQFDFNVFDWNEDQLVHYCLLIFVDLGLIAEFHIQLTTLQSFLQAVRSRYRQTPYHNFYHAVGVLQFGYMVKLNRKMKTPRHMKVFWCL